MNRIAPHTILLYYTTILYNYILLLYHTILLYCTLLYSYNFILLCYYSPESAFAFSSMGSESGGGCLGIELNRTSYYTTLLLYYTTILYYNSIILYYQVGLRLFLEWVRVGRRQLGAHKKGGNPSHVPVTEANWRPVLALPTLA